MGKHGAYLTGVVMDSENKKKKILRNCNTCVIGNCFERLGGYLTIPFKQVLKNLRVFSLGETPRANRPQSVKTKANASKCIGYIGAKI